MFARTNSAVILADERYEIKFVSSSFAADSELRRLVCEGALLTTSLRERLRGLNIQRLDPGSPHVIPLDERRVVHCSRLIGSEGDLYMLVVEAKQNIDALALASARFSLTRRETAVLELVLEGANARAIAETLEISEHTVHAYVKRLVAKTDARNRSSMIAAILDWDGSAAPRRHSGKEQRANRPPSTDSLPGAS